MGSFPDPLQPVARLSWWPAAACGAAGIHEGPNAADCRGRIYKRRAVFHHPFLTKKKNRDDCTDDKWKAFGELKSFWWLRCLLCASRLAPWKTWHLSFPVPCYIVPMLAPSTAQSSPAGGKTLLAFCDKAEEGCCEITCPLLVTRKGSPNLEDVLFSKGAPVSFCQLRLSVVFLLFTYHNS